MANLILSGLELRGPTHILERVREAIATTAVEFEGARYPKQFHVDPVKWKQAFPDWNDRNAALGILESRYTRQTVYNGNLRAIREPQEDGRAVRIEDGVLYLATETHWVPPVAFAKRLGQLFPELTTTGLSLQLSDNISERWVSQGGQTVLVERQVVSYCGNEIEEWEWDNEVWKWTNNRDADTRMMQRFLALECGANSDDLLAACQLAYDAMAFPNSTLRAEGNLYAYNLACHIADHRHGFAQFLDMLSRYPVRRADDDAETTADTGTIGDDATPANDDFLRELQAM
jgi:hypothetical protein